ncbi:MAG: DNA mismatch repair endonuclease MutL [Candidatus Riflebacteria bacterium]|nr:DNA mismatch repair endonuclease MutL [Candidatus Riflebacteria bacterium]
MTKNNVQLGSGIIKVLDESVVNQIAAGEVVERPASVVKELIENAIDAKAQAIEVEIKDGGQKLIEVVDDGIGMCQADAIRAFSVHATSKIESADDLNMLASLGFRGEALASVASVSKVTLITRQADSQMGTRVQIEFGQMKTVEGAAHPPGTTIQVKNIFQNVPARKKFLKSSQVETSNISDIICHYMLGYPEIAFRFTRSNVQIACSNGQGNLADAVLSVYGSEIARHLIPLKRSSQNPSDGISLKGFISPPNHARPSARFITTLVNRRFVRSKLLAQAISKALSAFFPKGRFPVLVLDLRIPSEMVDVNVHPQKTEVRFADERMIFGLVLESLQSSLSGLKMVSPVPITPESVVIQPELLGEESSENIYSSPHPTINPDFHQNNYSLSGTQQNSFPAANISSGLSINQTQNRSLPNAQGLSSHSSGNLSGHSSGRSSGNSSGHSSSPSSVTFSSQSASSDRSFSSQPQSGQNYSLKPSGFPPQVSMMTGSGTLSPVDKLQEPKILAQFMNSYLLGEDREGLFIIDQHAAHERVLFDTYVETYREQRIHAQPLLFPLPLKLLPSERMIIGDKLEELSQLGFSLQQEDDGQYYAMAVPIVDGKSTQNEIIQDLMGQVLGGWEGRTLHDVKIELLKTMSCKNAVKAGDPLKEPEMRSLFAQLLKTKNPYTCPHGRPVILRLSMKHIETAFLRT